MSACPACGKELPGEFPFCPFCAAPLDEPPAPLAREERKVVSVLFCDLVGFTAASEQADPEDVRARLRPYHERLRQVVERHGGTVEKFVGDAVMAAFGAPVAHEDDAERAVRAGLRILEAIADLNAADSTLGLQVRVGINTGEAVVALGARPELGEGFVTGDVVNTASRLQGIAGVGTVACSPRTYHETERVFEWEPLDPVTVKGKAEPIAAWRPLRPRARFGSEVIQQGATPLVGRELEKPLLVATFERAAQQRSCQLVTIVGEPGVGKSRLCAELLAYVEERPGLVRWRQGRCLPYGDGIALWALGEIVKAECGILESDSPQEAAAKLERSLPGGGDRAWLAARVAPLVGAGGEAATQEESFAAWRRFCESLAAERATVLVFEDLHWADPALLAFLEHLADWAQDVPLLLLCTARPELYERHPGFGADARNAQRINLPPLTDAETAKLIGALLERAVLPAETQAALLERAGGNPLYAEEFVRLLTDRGDPGELQVPGSVHALIAARLDTLAPERKSLLQDAAVVGKVFWAGALAAMSGRDRAEVERMLHELARKELVRPARTASMEDEVEYGFWHALVRDVCYGQIPRADRAARHLAAAAWLEARAGERVEDLADVLAHHYESALELGRAAGVTDQEDLQAQAMRYLTLAGGRALSLDVGQAERQLARALDLCPESAPERALLLERWAQAVQQLGRLQEARSSFERALDLHRAADDPVAVGRVLTRLGNVTHRLGDPHCEELIADAVELLEAQPAGPELVAAITYAAGRGMFTGRYREAIAGCERALSLAAELGLPKPAFALHIRGISRSDLGEAAGIEDVREALRLALEQGLGRETAVIHGNLAWQTWVYEGPWAALELIREASDFCERRGMTEIVLQHSSGIPTLLAALGQTEQALAEAGPIADRIEAGGDMSWLIPRSVHLRLLAETGNPRQAPDPEPLLAAARRIGLPSFVTDAFAAAARLLLAQGNPEQAHALLAELDELDENLAVRAEIVHHDLFPQLVRLALALGDTALAHRLVGAVEPRTPMARHSSASARAQLAEAAGEHREAALLYADAAARWEQFGDVPEHAYALLGQGRCLRALGDPTADQPLVDARELFAALGYRPACAETDALLAQSAAAL